MNWSDENYLEEFSKKYSLLSDEYLKELRKEIESQMLSFSRRNRIYKGFIYMAHLDHKAITFTYYLN